MTIDIDEAIDALGITRSDSNHLVKLWQIHCKDIEGLEFKATDYEEEINEDNFLTESEADDKQVISNFFALINDEKPQNLNWEREKYAAWIDHKITQLKRACSEIELHLRKKSEASISTKRERHQ